MNNNWKIFLLLLMFCSYLLCDDDYKRRYKYYKMLNIQGDNSDLRELIKFINNESSLKKQSDIVSSDETLRIIMIELHVQNFATYELGINKTNLLLHPNMLKKVKDFAKYMKLSFTEISSDFSELMRKETKRSLRDGEYNGSGYYDIDDINIYMASMQESFPHWSHLIIGGESYHGRKLVGLRILTNIPLPDNKRKPIVFIEAGLHAREWISPASALYLIDKLLTNRHPNVTSLRDSFDWHIFPVFNPDGYHHSFTTDRMWRKSMSITPRSHCVGVDLNRNWGFNFGVEGMSYNPCDYETYAGSKAFSEIEVRSIAKYIKKLDNIFAYLSFHSYAKCILLPYSDSTKQRIKNYTQMAKMAKRASDYAFKLNGDHYKVGNSIDLLVPVSGTSVDWAYITKKPPIALVLELRGSSFHWPADRLPEMGEEVFMMLVGIFEEARHQGLYRPALPYVSP